MKRQLFFIAVLAIIGLSGKAQWQLSSIGDSSFETCCFIEANGKLFAGGECFNGDHPIYMSTNNGNTWTRSDTGIASSEVIRCMGKSSNGLFAGGGNLWFSWNNGSYWYYACCYTDVVASISSSTDTLYDASDDGVFMSINGGYSWNYVNSFISSGYSMPTALIRKGNQLFVGTDSGIFITSIHDTSWTYLPSSPHHIYCLETDGTNIFAGIYSVNNPGIYVSTDNGQSWTHASGISSIYFQITTIKCVGNALLAGAGSSYSKKIYRSTDNGFTWTPFTNGIDTSYFYPMGFYATSSYVYCGGSASSVKSIYRIDINDVITGYETHNENEKISVYPNPANDNLTIETPQPATIEILSIEGQIIKRLKIKENKTNIDISDFSSGVYIIRAQTDNGIMTKKFIKE